MIQDLKKALRFYFITDDSAPDLSPVEQVKTAVNAGATMIQHFPPDFTKKWWPSGISVNPTGCR
jgi:hypothetical protein